MNTLLQGVAATIVGRGYLTSDHISTATGLDPAIMISKNGGNFANPAAGASVMTEIEATGWYKFALGTSDTDTLGPLVIRGTHATMDNIEVVYEVVAAVPSVNVTQWEGHAVHAHSEEGTPTVEVVRWGGNDVAATGINGTPKVDLAGILSHAITQTGTQVADGFQTFFDTASPVAVSGLATPTNITAGTITTATNVTTVNGLANNVITTASINDGAITNAKVDDALDVNVKTITNGAITAAAIATDAIDADALAADALTEIQASCNAALVANNLDHLCLTATAAADMTTEVADNTILSRVIANGDTSTFIQATDGLRAIASSVQASAPTATTATSGTATPTVTSGTYADTATQNSTYWQITASAGAAVSAELVYACGTGKLANTVRVIGRYQVAAAVTGKYVNVQAYNYKTSAYETISSTATRINGQTGSTDNTYTYALTVDHMKTDGEAKIKFVGSDLNATSSLYLDYVPYFYQTTGTSTDAIAQAVYNKMKYVVYEGGVWIDTVNGVAGTVVGDNGTPVNPVLTYADALTLAAAIGVKRFYLKPGTSITLTQDHSNWRFIGAGRIALGGQNIADCVFEDSYTISGLSTGDDANFIRCGIGAATLYHAYFHDCVFKDTVTFAASQDYFFIRCSDATPSSGTAAAFVFAASASAVFRDWHGGISINSLKSTNSCIIDGAGRVVIDATSTAGSLTVRGAFTVSSAEVTTFTTTPNTGSFTDTARWSEDQSLSAVTTVTNLTNAPTVGDLTATMKASVNAEVDTALTDIKLDHLVAVADSDDVVNNSIMAKLVSKDATADWSDFNNTTDSLEALRDRGDTAWITATADDVLDEAVEGTVTLRQAMRVLLSFAAGKATGGGTGTITLKDVNDTKSRIVMNVDSSGNRRTVTLDVT